MFSYINFIKFIFFFKKKFKFNRYKKNIILIEVFDFKPSIIAFLYFTYTSCNFFKAKTVLYYPKFFIFSQKLKFIFKRANPFFIVNVLKFILKSDLLIPNNNEENIDYQKILKKIKTKKDLLEIKIKGIWVGDLFYDEYLRSNDILNINVKSVHFKKEIVKYIKLFYYWHNKLSNKNVKALIISHNVYLIGVPSRIAINFRISVYSVRLTDIAYLTNKNPHAFGGFHNYRKHFKKLITSKKKIAIKLAKKQIDLRFKGKKDILYNLNQENDVRVFDKTKITSNKSQKFKSFKVLIAAHCFTDAPHAYGKTIFTDFYDWIDFLGKQTIDNNYEWYIKLHPADYDRNLEKIELFLKKYKNFQLIKKETTHNELIQKGINVVLTTYGSIAHEYPLFDIPVVNAGINPHISYKFSETPRSFNSYKNYIKNLKNIKVNKKVKKDIYEFYYMNFLSNKTPFKKIINKFQDENSYLIYKEFFLKRLNLESKKINREYLDFIKSKKFKMLDF